jgi:hypothetical protein
MTNQLNREPTNLNRLCSANQGTCTNQATVQEPVPICLNHGTELALAILPIAFAAIPVREPAGTGTTRRLPLRTVRIREGEGEVLNQLGAAGTPLTRRTVADAIRAAGGTCPNQRTAELAR